MTVIELIERCTARLEAAGVAVGHRTPNPFDQAARLVMWGLKLPLDALEMAICQPTMTRECTSSTNAT